MSEIVGAWILAELQGLLAGDSSLATARKRADAADRPVHFVVRGAGTN